MMRLSVALPLVSATSMSWEEFKNAYGRVYNGDEEEARRKQIFESNVEEIESHNAQKLSWTLEVNQFADLTDEEFVAQYTGEIETPFEDMPRETHEELDQDTLADAIDWVSLGHVNPIKDQGQCGSCWAFSATGTIESAYSVARGKLHVLSEQQMVDCDKRDDGCDGGLRDPGMTYLKGGACSSASYPYKAQDGSCKKSSCDILIQSGEVTGVVDVATKSPSALKSALNSMPIGVSVDGNKLKSYANGVVHNDCNTLVHNHAIIAVGYGGSGSDAYFKVRNSWGKSWGESGYVRLAQKGGTYGTACMLGTAPAYPKIAGGPTPTPTPSPTRRRAPTPTPTPTPTPGQCHAISALVDDDWCKANCAATPPFCPADLCECDRSVLV